MTEIQSLLLMKATLESANLHGVEAMLDDDCEYVSTGRGIIARNKRESLEFLTAMVDSIQSDHVPVICRVMHITEVPAAFATIIKSAFGFKAVAGGAMGSIIVAMQKGIARGIFSNEAGLGSAPIAAAAAQTKEPVRQGLVSMTGTFIDTIVICTLTGLSIVLTGAWQVDGLEGVQVTTYAFQNGLPLPKELSAFVLMLCLVFFAFTTILGWDYYSERCLEYLSGGRMKYVKVYRWIYILAVFIGPYMTVSAVWTIADIFNGLMALPNMIALFALSGVVVKETRHFFERHRNGEIED